jgi:hypothetical protein
MGADKAGSKRSGGDAGTYKEMRLPLQGAEVTVRRRQGRSTGPG